MEHLNLHLLCFFFFVLFFCCFSSAIAAKNIRQYDQEDAYSRRLMNKFRIDNGDFHSSGLASDLENEEESTESLLKETDRIEHGLPGQPPVEFDQYGGYVTVSRSAGRALFYYFVEAAPSLKESLPLLLWLNGGPGCSSLSYGAMQELGPFRVNSDGETLYRNQYAWNRVANVLFLETPAGVGFSYSNSSMDYKNCGDRRTASDNYVFLTRWLDRFPEYKKRDFYIAGESYAGHYIPQLAVTIVRRNIRANKTIINFKGVLIGNPLINDPTDLRGRYDYWESHALVSDQVIRRIHRYCDFSRGFSGRTSDGCEAATNDSWRGVQGIDIYNIYAPLCDQAAPRVQTPAVEFDPCSEDYVYSYMNREDVQSALHANITHLEHDWEPCSDIITWNDRVHTVIPLLRALMVNGLRVWLFSGDVDGRIPITSTKYSVNAMRLRVSSQWRPWFSMGEVGGYTATYRGRGGLTLATVRGAGHQVPSYKPLPSLLLVTHFLNSTSLPSKPKFN